MENQTCFDLNAAIENWRQELAAQSNLTMEVRRELETHLRDTIAELRQRGLNEDESFWLARRRVGQPPQIGEEFVKADPVAVWRERVFWMVLAALILTLWGASVNVFWVTFANKFLYTPATGIRLFYENCFRAVFNWLPILVCALVLAKGRLGFNHPRLLIFFRSRFRITVGTLAWVIINSGMTAWYFWQAMKPINNGLSGSVSYRAASIAWASIWNSIINMTIWPLLLAILLVWLIPSQLKAKPKVA